MGYWSEHPMGGDSPLDDKEELMRQVYELTEAEESLFYSPDSPARAELIEKMKNLFIEKLPQLIEFSENLDCPWVLPYQIVEFEIKITDKNLSDQIKELIGDGGSEERYYDKDEKESPLTHASYLYSIWDELMAGTKPFENLEDPGLLAAFAKKISEDNNEGFININ
jgi:hypothetical protein